MSNQRQSKPTVGFQPIGRPASKPAEQPRKALPAPEPDPIPDDEPEGIQDAPETTDSGKAEPLPVRLYPSQRGKLDRIRKAMIPGTILSRSAAIRWLIDRYPE